MSRSAVASVFAGLRVEGGQKVLEHLAQQFGVQRDLPLDGRVLLHCELVSVEQGYQAIVAEEEAIGDRVVPAVVRIVGEAVYAVAAVACCLFAVQAVEQAAIDEWGLPEQFKQGIGVGHFGAITVSGEVAVGGVVHIAETAPVYFGVQRGEEQSSEEPRGSRSRRCPGRSPSASRGPGSPRTGCWRRVPSL